MAKYAFRKLVPTVLGIGILIPTTYFAHDGYIKSTAQSNFEITANRLGFIGYKKTGKAISAQEHQEALLNQLQIAGYLQPTNLWKAIVGLGVKDPVTVFKQIYPAIKNLTLTRMIQANLTLKYYVKTLEKEQN